MLQYLLGIFTFLIAVFLILLILVQRGRGGGLSGALGGMGGQSAFGTKAGDMFTRITMGAATFWILMCLVSIWTLNRQSAFSDGGLFGGGGAETNIGATEGEGTEGDSPPAGSGLGGLLPESESDTTPPDDTTPGGGN